jgi:hypothetical protein
MRDIVDVMLAIDCDAYSCVDGPRLARGHVTRRTEVACSHVSGLLMQSE